MPEESVIIRKPKLNSSLLIVQFLCLSAGIALLMITPYSCLVLGLERTLLWVIGVTALLILTVPFLLRREFDMFEPITFVLLTVLFGITLRAIYIAVYDNDTINKLLLLGRDRCVLLSGGIIILFSLLALISGYMMQTPILNIRRFRLFRKERWSTPSLFVVVFFFTAIGIISMILFIRKVGIASFALNSIIAKHFYFVEGAEYQLAALGYHRWGASLIVPAFYLYLCWFAASGKKWFSIWGAGVMLLGLLAAVFPFITSSRSDVINIIIFAVVLWHYLRRKIRIRILVCAFVFILAINTIMLVLRTEKVTKVGDIASYVTVEAILDGLVGNRNLFGIDKTGHIINAVPGRLPYQYGRSLLSIIVAPVPRSTWPGKPPILLGATIGQIVYETKDKRGLGAGIPPGFVAELYLNFGLFGVLLGMFMLGMWLKFLYKSLSPYLKLNPNAAIVYVTVMYGSSFRILSGDFTGAAIFILMLLIPLAMALCFIGRTSAYRKQSHSRYILT